MQTRTHISILAQYVKIYTNTQEVVLNTSVYICVGSDGRVTLVRKSLGLEVLRIRDQLRRRDINHLPGRKRVPHTEPDANEICLIILWFEKKIFGLERHLTAILLQPHHNPSRRLIVEHKFTEPDALAVALETRLQEQVRQVEVLCSSKIEQSCRLGWTMESQYFSKVHGSRVWIESAHSQSLFCTSPRRRACRCTLVLSQ